MPAVKGGSAAQRACTEAKQVMHISTKQVMHILTSCTYLMRSEGGRCGGGCLLVDVGCQQLCRHTQLLEQQCQGGDHIAAAAAHLEAPANGTMHGWVLQPSMRKSTLTRGRQAGGQGSSHAGRLLPPGLPVCRKRIHQRKAVLQGRSGRQAGSRDRWGWEGEHGEVAPTSAGS